MLRWTKWIAPLTSLVLLASVTVAQSHAADAVAPTGKAKVTVTVVDGDGKPVSGATVSISVAPPKGKKLAPATTQPDGAVKPKPVVIESGVTGADGTYALTAIADGDFVVMSRAKSIGNGRTTVTVADGKDQTVSVTLKLSKKKATTTN